MADVEITGQLTLLVLRHWKACGLCAQHRVVSVFHLLVMFSIGKTWEKYRRCYHLGTSARSPSRGWGWGVSVPGRPPHRVLLGYRSTPTQSPEWSFGCSRWGLKISRDGKAPLYSWPVTTTLPWRLWLRLWVVPMQGRFRGFTPACAGELLWRCQFVIHQNCKPRLLSVWRGSSLVRTYSIAQYPVYCHSGHRMTTQVDLQGLNNSPSAAASVVLSKISPLPPIPVGFWAPLSQHQICQVEVSPRCPQQQLQRGPQQDCPAGVLTSDLFVKNCEGFKKEVGPSPTSCLLSPTSKGLARDHPRQGMARDQAWASSHPALPVSSPPQATSVCAPAVGDFDSMLASIFIINPSIFFFLSLKCNSQAEAKRSLSSWPPASS